VSDRTPATDVSHIGLPTGSSGVSVPRVFVDLYLVPHTDYQKTVGCRGRLITALSAQFLRPVSSRYFFGIGGGV
jgi:hypothetical protein